MIISSRLDSLNVTTGLTNHSIKMIWFFFFFFCPLDLFLFKCQVKRKQRVRRTHTLKRRLPSVKSSVFLWHLCKPRPLWHMVLHFSLPVWSIANVPADHVKHTWGGPNPAGHRTKTLVGELCLSSPLINIAHWCHRRQVTSSIPRPGALSVRSLHGLPVCAWVLSRYCLPQSKNTAVENYLNWQ